MNIRKFCRAQDHGMAWGDGRGLRTLGKRHRLCVMICASPFAILCGHPRSHIVACCDMMEEYIDLIELEPPLYPGCGTYLVFVGSDFCKWCWLLPISKWASSSNRERRMNGPVQNTAVSKSSISNLRGRTISGKSSARPPWLSRSRPPSDLRCDTPLIQTLRSAWGGTSSACLGHWFTLTHIPKHWYPIFSRSRAISSVFLVWVCLHGYVLKSILRNYEIDSLLWDVSSLSKLWNLPSSY